MKKFALSLVAVAACAGAFRAYESYQQIGESDALLAENVLALSAGDGSKEEQFCSQYGGVFNGEKYEESRVSYHIETPAVSVETGGGKISTDIEFPSRKGKTIWVTVKDGEKIYYACRYMEDQCCKLPNPNPIDNEINSRVEKREN